MTKKRLSILLTLLAVAVDVVAIVLLVPVFISPADHPIGTVTPVIGLIVAGLLLGLASSVLRKQSKAPAQS